MCVWHKKIPSGALQFVVLIGVVIAVLLASFVLLVYTRGIFRQQSAWTTEVVRNGMRGMDYALSHALVGRDTVTLPVDDLPYKDLKLHQSYWGIMEKITVVSRIRNRKITRVALAGGWQPSEERPALYLQDRNRPLVVVGDTRLSGTIFLPEAGIKAGNISGQAYYGGALMQGRTKRSETELPGLSAELEDYLQAMCRGAFDLNDETVFFPEPGTVYTHSFLERTRYVYDPDTIDLSGVHLTGNMIVCSAGKIVVDSSTRLTDVLLIAPEITIKDHSRGTFQALATERITVGKNCVLEYPSALVVCEQEESRGAENTGGKSSAEGAEDKGIFLDTGTLFKGMIVFKGKERERNYVPQLYLAEDTQVYGELYCNQNTELKGRVGGTVYTGNVMANQSGSVYQNHLYHTEIDGTVLPDQYCGLLLEDIQKGVAKWLY